MIVHCYKLDVSRSSRVIMQMSWMHDNKVLSRGPSYDQTSWFNFKNTLRCIDLVEDVETKLVFHGQSSILILVVAKLYSLLTKKRIVFIYDIHDLNENYPKNISYLRIRYYVMFILEYIVLKILRVRAITVSRIISNIYRDRYNVNVKIVYNVSVLLTRLETIKTNYGIVYFGTGERFPTALIDVFENNNTELHVYGMGMSSAMLRSEIVRFHGEYNPNNMGFLSDYGFLVLYSDDQSENFKGSMPNKLFQAMSYNLMLIISSNFVEIITILDEYDCKYIVIDGAVELNRVLKNPRERWFDNSISYKSIISNLYEVSRRNYIEALSSQ